MNVAALTTDHGTQLCKLEKNLILHDIYFVAVRPLKVGSSAAEKAIVLEKIQSGSVQILQKLRLYSLLYITYIP